MQNNVDQRSAIEPGLRQDDSGLWFSPQPPPERAAGERNPDSALFDLATVAATTKAGPPRVSARSTEAAGSAGSGLIDIRTLAAAANDPLAEPVVPQRSITLLPSLVAPLSAATIVPTSAPATAPSTRPMLLAVVGLLAVLVALLGYLVAT